MSKKKLSMFDMVKNFAKETIEYAKQGAPNVSTEDYQERLETCGRCEHLKEDQGRCGLCGCVVEHKAKWATSKCPDERWEPQIVGKGGKTVKLSKRKESLAYKKRRLKKMRDERKGNNTKTGD
tara:strand:- start:553 stop:921 length:369 start_codon:yes stop_codon:yes gene_type:complete